MTHHLVGRKRNQSSKISFSLDHLDYSDKDVLWPKSTLRVFCFVLIPYLNLFSRQEVNVCKDK